MIKNILNQPFDYEDFFNYNYYLGLKRIQIATELFNKGIDDMVGLLFLLANENLDQMRIIAKLQNGKKTSPSQISGRINHG